MSNKTLAGYMSEIYDGDVEEYKSGTDVDEQEPDFEDEGAEIDKLPFKPIPEEEGED